MDLILFIKSSAQYAACVSKPTLLPLSFGSLDPPFGRQISDLPGLFVGGFLGLKFQT